MDLLQTVGQCDNGYACVYHNNWLPPTTPPAEAHPRLVFENLFGDGGLTPSRATLRRASLLDSITAEMKRLQSGLGAADERVSGRADSIRE